MISINGEKVEYGNISLFEYLESTQYDIRRIAVEINGEIITKAEYENTVLHDGDSIEIVSFVGGG